jgi:hypothetical protein
MATTPRSSIPPEPFRWKLFTMIMLIMASITAAAIILTLMATPSKGGIHAPGPQPISRLNLPGADHQNPVSAL